MFLNLRFNQFKGDIVASKLVHYKTTIEIYTKRLQGDAKGDFETVTISDFAHHVHGG